MALTSFPVYVLYNQLCVFWSSLQQPFNDWLQTHVDQGFSWRQGSACFRTLEEDGKHLIELEVSAQPVEVSAGATRVIEVPFEVPTDGNIEIASISDSFRLSLAAGAYTLRCELFNKTENGDLPVRLIFMLSDSQVFKIVRADASLSPPAELVKDAMPAN